MSDLDQDGNEHVDAQEWTAAPGLAAGARFIDQDKDGRLSREEIETRFNRYCKQRVGLQPQSFRVTYKGRPVAGAEAEFVPEPFQDGLIQPARGTTDDRGIVSPQTEGHDALGMQPGYYRVRIDSPEGKIPAKYSAAALLGAEASPLNDNPFATSVPELRITD